LLRERKKISTNLRIDLHHIYLTMQFTTLSVAFFAALASAHNLHGAQHFHHRRAYNTSSMDSGESTTLTVYSTQIHTITSCAASITDCPARASESTSEMVVTDVITLATVSSHLSRESGNTNLDYRPSAQSLQPSLLPPQFTHPTVRASHPHHPQTEVLFPRLLLPLPLSPTQLFLFPLV